MQSYLHRYRRRSTDCLCLDGSAEVAPSQAISRPSTGRQNTVLEAVLLDISQLIPTKHTTTCTEFTVRCSHLQSSHDSVVKTFTQTSEFKFWRDLKTRWWFQQWHLVKLFSRFRKTTSQVSTAELSEVAEQDVNASLSYTVKYIYTVTPSLTAYCFTRNWNNQ